MQIQRNSYVSYPVYQNQSSTEKNQTSEADSLKNNDQARETVADAAKYTSVQNQIDIYTKSSDDSDDSDENDSTSEYMNFSSNVQRSDNTNTVVNSGTQRSQSAHVSYTVATSDSEEYQKTLNVVEDTYEYSRQARKNEYLATYASYSAQ